VVADVINDIRAAYPNREIHFKAQEKVEMEVDEALFSVAVKNLVENALKYSEDEVDITLDADALRIRDRGIGLDKEEIEKVTSKFYRVSKNGWDNSLGIGLSLVAHIVRVHGFELDIQSEKSVGSVFSIVFA